VLRKGAGEAAPAPFFIPDLCRVQAVFLLVLVGELLALVLCVAARGVWPFDWQRFATTSLFVQWVLLASAAGLCLLRPRLAHWPRARAAALCYGWVLLVAALVSLAAQWLTAGGFDGRALAGNLLISAVLGGIALRYFYLEHELRLRQRAELEARIDALQARIRPHFLFNGMNSIASLIAIDPVAAERAVEDLAALFRASLGRAAQVPLAEELALCRSYLRIEQLRLGERLRVEWQLAELAELADDLPVPALSLQPLLENAIYHGIQRLPAGGEVNVTGWREGDRVHIRVSNPMPLSQDERRGGNRMALANIGHRLRALYGDDAAVITGVKGGKFCAELSYRPGAQPDG
jgi:two-component system sensor histidine kinase AlgZ